MAVAVYGLATLHSMLLWRRGFAGGQWVHYGLIALGFIVHSAALLYRGFSLKQCPVTNLFEAVMFAGWVTAAAFLLGALWPVLRPAGVLLAPGLFASGIFALQPALDDPASHPGLEQAAVSLHVTLVLLAYAAFGLGSLAAGLYLIRDARFVHGRVQEVIHRSARPERLERVLSGSLIAGLLLLTAGLAMSFGLMREHYGVFLRFDPKIAWSLVVWVVYLGLLIARLHFHQAARGLAWGALGVFAFVALTSWGSNLLSPIHQP
jgi:ABC-type uncharacterized transport system permease subunit